MSQKLYTVRGPCYVRVVSENVVIPLGSHPIKKGDLLYFDHIDGMYSLCHIVDEQNMKHIYICHLSAFSEVEVIDLSELFSFEQIRELIARSGRGKDGRGKWRTASLKDMNDEWVKASIDYVEEDHPHRKFYIQELEYRKEHGITIPDLENEPEQ